jgi:transglutaminase-like putative cysteine protease
MKLRFWLILIILAPGAQAVDNNKKLSGNLAKYVHWSPTRVQHSYNEQLPQPEKIAAFGQLGYGTVTLLEKHNINLKNDGIVEETVTQSQLYITSSGIEKNGNSVFWFDADNEKVDIQEAYVLQPNGDIVPVSPETLQITSDNSLNSFNNYYFVTIPFVQLKPGSISILVYKSSRNRKRWPLPWSRLLYIGVFNHTESFQANVEWADKRMKPAWKTDFAPLECKEGPQALTCATKDAIPPLPTETDMPSANDILPVLVLAEPTSWAEISNAMQTLTESALSKNNKIKELADHLVNGVTQPEEKISLLAAFVSRDIRYVGFEHGNSGVIPKPTLTTLEHRFGDCKDKTMLFVDLVRNVGLDAYPVLTSTKRNSISKLLLPSSSYFDHMIACVKVNPKKESCIDLTEPYTSANYLPQSIQGAVSLTVGNETVGPRNLPTELYAWKIAVKANNQITETGSIIEKLERKYDSHWGANLRGFLVAQSLVDQQRWLLENYQDVMGNRGAPDIKISGLERPDSPIEIATTTEFRDIFNFNISLSRPNGYSDIDYWLIDLAQRLAITNTHYSYQRKGIDYQSEFTYELPSGKKTTNIGPKLDYESVWGQFHRYYRDNGSSVTVHTDLKIPNVEVPVTEIADFNRYLDLIRLQTRVWFTFQ